MGGEKREKFHSPRALGSICRNYTILLHTICVYIPEKTLFLLVDMIIGKVGSKGELFPPKSIREQIGLKPGQKVVYRVLNGRMIVEKYIELDEILSKSSKIEISFDDIKKDRKAMSEEITNR